MPAGESRHRHRPVRPPCFASGEITDNGPQTSDRSITNLNEQNAAFDRLSRYETALWRQTLEIVLLLNSINRSSNLDGNDVSANYLRLRASRRTSRGSFGHPLKRQHHEESPAPCLGDIHRRLDLNQFLTGPWPHFQTNELAPQTWDQRILDNTRGRITKINHRRIAVDINNWMALAGTKYEASIPCVRAHQKILGPGCRANIFFLRSNTPEPDFPSVAPSAINVENLVRSSGVSNVADAMLERVTPV